MHKPPFQFSPEQQADLRRALNQYFATELDIEIGDLQTDLLLEFLNTQIGRYYYNQGITDAIAAIKERADDLVLLIKE
jgi:uncharacterized protein (DUF2164 family)